MIDFVHGMGKKLAHKLFKLVRSWLINFNVLHRIIILTSRNIRSYEGRARIYRWKWSVQLLRII